MLIENITCNMRREKMFKKGTGFLALESDFDLWICKLLEQRMNHGES